jgi:hypothetical protein
MSGTGWRILGDWDSAKLQQDVADLGEALRIDLKNNAMKSAGVVEKIQNLEATPTKFNYYRPLARNKKIAPTNYARLIVGILTVLSTILTGMLYACYQHPTQLKSNLRDFAIAMICITALFCLLSIVTLIYFKGVSDDPNGHKKIIIGICLVVELCDIAASVYIYMNNR